MTHALAEKVVLITGASSGIGEAIARSAARAGCSLSLAARSIEKLRAIADEIGTDRVLATYCDVSQYGSIEDTVTQTLQRFGRIDAVCANAGRGGEPGGFSAASPDSWREIVDTNILGVAYTLRACMSAVRKARGHIVITSSVAGRRVLAGSMYAASKWAVTAIGYAVREELKGSGVRVTLIEPGMVDTAFFDEPKPDALRADSVARCVLFALEQPASVDVHELVVLPTPPADA